MNSDLQFRADSLGTLLFSRGRGRGHVIPDVAIVEELTKLNPDVDIRFVSYATGVETLAELGHGVIDLGLPEKNDLVQTLILAARVIGYMRPKLVIAHEEFAALPAAKITSVPTIFLTDWFVEDSMLNMHLLAYADATIFLDQPGTFEEPQAVEGRIEYAKPVLRAFHYNPGDRPRARRELELPEDAAVISVIVPPGRRIEKFAPIHDLLMPAFEALEANKVLVWVAGEDHQTLAERTKSNPKVIVKKDHEPFDQLMVASDLVITKGNRNIVLEAAALGVPTLSVSHNLNRIDDFRTFGIPTNRTVFAEEITSEEFLTHIRKALAEGRQAELAALHPWAVGGARCAAEKLAAAIEQIRNSEAA